LASRLLVRQPGRLTIADVSIVPNGPSATSRP
jgi:hypothetical protein